MKKKKFCVNCKYAYVRSRKKVGNKPNVVCMLKSNFKKGYILMLYGCNKCGEWKRKEKYHG